jgi:hypothetical protein
MSSERKYATPSGLRVALEQRLKQTARASHLDLERLRRQVAFDRFLARLFSHDIKGLIAKGGYTLELRFNNARATKDIDFSFTGDLGGVWKGRPENLQEFLFTYAQVDLEDFFNFVIGPSIGELENAPYGGFRFPIEARMAGRRFTRFSIDIAAGDVWFEPHEKIGLHDWLGFAGIPPAEIPIISKEQQFAEKLHSYSLVRDYPKRGIHLNAPIPVITESDKNGTRMARIIRIFADR